MSRMADDLFELSRITSRAIQLQTQQVELLDVLSNSVADVVATTDRHGVRIGERSVGSDVLWADPHQLGRIVVTLLTNAIRHAPRGTEIVISASEVDRKRLVLGVHDHGAGVAVEDLDRMFDVGGASTRPARHRWIRTVWRRKQGSGCRSRVVSPAPADERSSPSALTRGSA